MCPKEYQQDLFAEVRAEDELVILARGLGLLRLVVNLLHSYDAVGNNLIVIVGADERENGWIGEGILARGSQRCTRQLTLISAGGACCCEQIVGGTGTQPGQHGYDECWNKVIRQAQRQMKTKG